MRKVFRLQVTVVSFLLLLFTVNCTLSPVHAISDPLSVPNNKFGIHIIQPTPDESFPAAQLVNTNGDWGYITVLMEQKDKKKDKWQEFFNDLRRRHLIPIVRLATEPVGDLWKRPDPDDANSWADFLNSLVWPTKNRYVVIFNEPNQSHEWGGVVDAKGYAQVLDKWIGALKSRSEDFFVMNAGFDASAPNQPPNYEDEVSFLQQMNQEAPGIFEKLDGCVSHSYPNPGFVGSPQASGRGTVRTWYWEQQQLKNLGVNKSLPIFITETGWKHAEGLNFDPRLPTADSVAYFYKDAYYTAWNDKEIVAVTPFLLSYQENPFDHFSFKKSQSLSEYYSIYQTLADLPKVSGKPVQQNLAILKKGEIYSSIVAGESYNIFLTFQNSGQSIWNERDQIKLLALEGGQNLGIKEVEIPKDIRTEPGQEYTFNMKIKAPLGGSYKVFLNLFEGNQQFSSNPVQFTTQVKSPVILQIKTTLRWKKEADGNYVLIIKGPTGNTAETIETIILNKEGISPETEARFLLPDYSFEFSLEKPFYIPKTIHQTVYTGVNLLDFGILQPDIISALLHPRQLWKLLPFSN